MNDFYFDGNIIRSKILQAMEPEILHGFSCRAGGISKNEHTQSMNLGFLRGDDDETVKENLRFFCAGVGFSSSDCVLASQTHSTNVVYATEELKFKGSLDMTPFGFSGVDGFVTDRENIGLLIRIADCVPILFADKKARVIGACHSGWRGTKNKISEITLSKMIELGARAENIVCAVGASISPCCYTVGDDFAAAFEADAPELLPFITRDDGVYRADLKAMNAFLLEKSGVLPEHIAVNPACTCCRPDIYFSHRATAGKRGTMAATIVLLPSKDTRPRY